MPDCPFGEKYQRYWDRRYDYFSRFDENILLDAEGCHTVMPETAALTLASRLSTARIVVDGFCGVGGISIALARHGIKVIAIDINKNRLHIAEHNAKIYGVDHHIHFIHGDFFSIVEQQDNADATILDPPWGWPHLKKLDQFTLDNLEPSGKKLLQFSLPRFKTIVLRVPRQFDFHSLDCVTTNYVHFPDLLQDELISRSIFIDGY